MLGFPELNPWQRDAFDVMFEVDDDGRLHYDVAILLVPRRAGKTVIDLSALVHRAQAFDRAQRSISTMQSGIASREMFKNTWVPTLERSAFGGLFKPTFQISHEELRWGNGSLHVVTAPTEKAGVGGDFDLWVCDEAWAHRDNTLEGAILPTQATRVQPQTLVTSMAGDDSSGYLLAKRDMGRALVESGRDSRTCYIEYAAPEGADPMDPATWWATHPALGFTISEARLRSYAESMEEASFAKEFLGIWPRGTAAAPIPLALWDACADPATLANDPVSFAVDVTPDRAWSAIAVAGRRPDGLLHLEVVDHRPGTGWVVARLEQLRRDWKPAEIAADFNGPAGSLKADMEAANIDVRAVTPTEHAQACGRLYDEVVTGQVRHRGQLMLAKALDEATKRPLGDGGWAWSRKSSAVDICPLVAVTLAGWAVDSAKAPASALGAVW